MDADARLSRLRAQAGRVIQTPLKNLVADDPARAQAFALRVGPLYANFARQHYDRDALEALFELAEQAGVRQKLQALFDGEKINLTEGRSVLHTALRGDVSSSPVARAAHAQALEARARMRALVDALAASDVTDIVSVGIGGSDLGPRLAVDALTGAAPGRFRVHFLSNVDGHAAQRVLAGLDPRRTAAVLISKTFGTQETLLNGAILRDWLGGTERAVRGLGATSSAPPRHSPFRPSASCRCGTGSVVAIRCGPRSVSRSRWRSAWTRFEAMLDGAAQMDAHVLDTPLPQNLAAWHALTAIWNRNALGYATQAVLAYDERLKLLSNYLQQLVMESLGKSVRTDGVARWQSTPCRCGGAVRAPTPSTASSRRCTRAPRSCLPTSSAWSAPMRRIPDNHRALQANLLAQTEAFANGQASDDPHRAYAGGRPSTMILLDALTPQSFGALLALYEHSVYLQSVMWGINAFDQFGVELGKQVASRLLPALAGDAQADDPVTRELLSQLR